MNKKKIVRITRRNVTNYSENSEFKCYFNFFPTVLIVRGTFWCRDLGKVVEKGNFSGKGAICSVKKETFVERMG